MKVKALRSSEGFTLIEILFVLAIVAALAAILIPIALTGLGDADQAKAKSDIDAIATAITKFYADLRLWPASDGDSALDQDVSELYVGDAGTTLSLRSNPTVTSTGMGWNTTNLPGSGDSPVPAQKYVAYNHLGINDPGATDYRSEGANRWRGPYLAKFSRDPWGKNYVANIGSISGKQKVDGGAANTGAEKGWILSAGPDNVITTPTTATTLSADDVGYIFCTSCSG